MHLVHVPSPVPVAPPSTAQHRGAVLSPDSLGPPDPAVGPQWDDQHDPRWTWEKERGKEEGGGMNSLRLHTPGIPLLSLPALSPYPLPVPFFALFPSLSLTHSPPPLPNTSHTYM